MIDLTFKSINRLFALAFKNGDDDPTQNYFDEYYMLFVEIKDFNAVIDNKPFFDQPMKTNKNRMKNLVEISRNDDKRTRNLLHYSYHKNFYKIIGIKATYQGKQIRLFFNIVISQKN